MLVVLMRASVIRHRVGISGELDVLLSSSEYLRSQCDVSDVVLTMALLLSRSTTSTEGYELADIDSSCVAGRQWLRK